MGHEGQTEDSRRRQALRDMLTRLRDQTYARVRDFRRDQQSEAELPPADDIDVARATADVETHASLIERAEYELGTIDEALQRVEHGTYGACADCDQEIPVERLTALPFALCCVDCQEKRNHARRRSGEGTMIPPYDHQWTVPEEMAEPNERRVTISERQSARPHEEHLPPEGSQGGKPGGSPDRRGRPRKKPAPGGTKSRA
jgi:DnaK suppressor protein